MQYAKLQAGTQYLFSDSNGWETKSHARVSRVRLLSTDKHQRRYAAGGMEYVKSDRYGDLLRACSVNDDGTDGRDVWVTTRQLRATWADGIARRDAELKRQQTAARSQAQRMQTAEEAAYDLVRAAEELGLPVRAVNETGWGNQVPIWNFKIRKEDLEKWISEHR
jgi:hypothetical protein